MSNLKKMEWGRLLSEKRIGRTKSLKSDTDRSEFQRDFDRLVFSTAFRRLQDKAQVVPLSESDYPRTRLTHSLEVSSVGRSLGTLAGKKILKNNSDLKEILDSSDFGAIVAAACLAHDIGNPPFGHSGEDAIQQWFTYSQKGKKVLNLLEENQRSDFTGFEGNAQGLRILTRLQCPARKGGMQLTFATLATFLKYPTSSLVAKKVKEKNIGEECNDGPKSSSKHGFFQDDEEIFKTIINEVGLIKNKSSWARHPLTFLVESADDICYLIADLEDSFLLNNTTFEEIDKLLTPIVQDEFNHKKYGDLKSKIVSEKDIQLKKDIQQELIEYLRAKAIDELIKQVVQIFGDEEKAILDGKFDSELLSKIKCRNHIDSIREFSKKRVYKTKESLRVQVPGFQIIGSLLDAFVPSIINLGDNSHIQPKNKKIKEFMQGVLGFKAKELEEPDIYKRLLYVTDFISGMTDSYAISIYKTITGISLQRI